MADRVEPCDDAYVKSEPIERHHEHEEYRNGPHFPYQFSVFVISTAACAARSAACSAADNSSTATPARRFDLIIDTSWCTSDTPRRCRSTWRNHWPRLRSPAASPALRPTTFSSFPPTARV